MIRALEHIVGYISGRPLLIQQQKLGALLAGLEAAMMMRGAASAAPPPPPNAEADERPRGYRLNRGVAIVPIHGVLVHRAGQMRPPSTELQSYERLTQRLRAAAADPRARALLLDIDSPGGEAAGLFDIADEIRRIAKPVWAVANDDALSAAYALAAPAQRIWITRTGAAGSIGVVAVHIDQSRRDAEEGLAYTYIYSGARKIDGNPHMPLSPEAQIAFKRETDRVHGMLVQSVAGGRRRAPEALPCDAEIFYGEDAVAHGLADEIGSLDTAAAALAAAVMPSPAPARRTAPPQGAAMSEYHEDAETGEVVDLDAVRNGAINSTRLAAGEVAALCALAGYPQLAADFIREGATLEAVRQALQTHQARDAAPPVVPLDTTQARTGEEQSELRRAVARRFAAQAGRPPP